VSLKSAKLTQRALTKLTRHDGSRPSVADWQSAVDDEETEDAEGEQMSAVEGWDDILARARVHVHSSSTKSRITALDDVLLPITESDSALFFSSQSEANVCSS
jgi:hypothetical protein